MLDLSWQHLISSIFSGLVEFSSSSFKVVQFCHFLFSSDRSRTFCFLQLCLFLWGVWHCSIQISSVILYSDVFTSLEWLDINIKKMRYCCRNVLVLNTTRNITALAKLCASVQSKHNLIIGRAGLGRKIGPSNFGPHLEPCAWLIFFNPTPGEFLTNPPVSLNLCACSRPHPRTI